MQKSDLFKKWFYIICLGLIFVLGFYLRLKSYLINQSFNHDECALAWSVLNKSYVELFEPLRFLQVAPPLFLAFIKTLINVFGTQEYIYRSYSFVSSVLSIIAFYFLTKNLFNTQKAVIVSNLLFALSFPLYYYASEFKPYSSDVLFSILSLLLIINLKPKNLSITLLILSLFIWFSFPIIFFILVILSLVVFDKKYFLKEKILSFSICLLNAVLFYFIYFLRVFNIKCASMRNYWDSEFLSVDTFIPIIKSMLSFMFSSSFVIPILILLGVFAFIKQKHIFIKFVIGLSLVVAIFSLMKLYPLFGRLILFLIPIFIVLLVKSIDKKEIILLLVLLICCIPQFDEAVDFLKKQTVYKAGTNPKEMVVFLKEHVLNDDIVFINTASNSDYIYYSQIYDLKNVYVTDDLSKLKKGDKVWFFLANNPNDWILEELKLKYTEIYSNVAQSSMLIYAQKIKL